MATPVRLYQSEMHENLGFFATWFPDDSIDIGDVGTLENGRFRRMSSLRELGIDYQVTKGRSKANVNYSSTNSTSIETRTSGEVPGAAKAEINIQFSQQGAFVFQASQLQQLELENRAEVAARIIAVYEQKKWDKAWLLVEAVYAADRATIIVSHDKSAGLVLAANLDQALPTVSLVDPKLSLAVKSTQGKIVHVIGQKNLHPLFSCLRIKDPLFGAATVAPVRGMAGLDAASAFSRPGVEELLG